VRYFVQNPESLHPPGFISSDRPTDKPVVVSPDAQHFFFVFFHGDVASDSVVYELCVFAVRDVLRAIARKDHRTGDRPKPLRRVVFRSAYSDSHESAAIFAPRWEDDRSILFIGVNDREPHRVYRLRVDTGAVTALTEGPNSVLLSSIDRSFVVRGDSIVFKSREVVPWRPLDEYPMATIRSNELQQLVAPYQYVWKLYASHRGRPERQVASAPQNGGISLTRISPDEKWCVIVYTPLGERVPRHWLQYERPSQRGYRFALVDMERGSVKQLLDAPAGTVTEAGRGRETAFDAFWSADSRHVVLYNTALPFTENAEERRRMSYIVVYSADSGQWSILQPMADPRGNTVEEAYWVREGKEFLVAHRTKEGAPGARIAYAFDGRRWTSRVVEPSLQSHRPTRVLPGGLSVTVYQSANDPPVVVASQGTRQVPLTDPDPALDGIWRARGELVEWVEPEGTIGRSLLRLPRDFSSERPAPLVIQASSDSSSSFRPDGSALSAFAAQALVAQGFAVLDVNVYDDRSIIATPREGPRFVERVDAAVDMLMKRGIADPTRVGLVGFSRTGFLTYFAITHPGRVKVSAAVVFDAVTISYGEYVLTAGLDPSDVPTIYEQQYGDGTYWRNKRGWQNAPAFNVDRNVTPVLFSGVGERGHWAALGALETIGAFSITKRPFDYLYFPQGAHVLQRPRERIASMQATVDWMNFWLQGRERAAADAGDRFERWRKMKGAWEETLAVESATRDRESYGVADDAKVSP
jgi:dipeptidyl aminopeptidase/acylaminoacyl peptidase